MAEVTIGYPDSQAFAHALVAIDRPKGMIASEGSAQAAVAGGFEIDPALEAQRDAEMGERRSFPPRGATLRAIELTPILGELGYNEGHSFNGLLQTTADGGPSMGESQKVRGLWYCVGIWVKDGPGMGKLIADWMTDGRTAIDHSRIDYARFNTFQLQEQFILERCTETARKIYNPPVHPREPFAGASSGWSRGIAPWDFGLPAGGGLPPIAMHIYTDRPIYRAGQTVFFKGVVRRERDAAFSLPQAGAADLTITSASGEQLYQQQLQLNANGAFDGKIELPAGASLGGYSIVAGYGGQSFGASFQVAAYRAPEFEVQVNTPAAELVRGAPIDATAEVSYFFGGPVANAPVQWNVLADSYRFSPPWGGRYQFGDTDDPWRCWECWWRPVAPPQPIMSGSGTTDAQGNLLVTIPADLKDAQGVPITDSVRLTIEATVTGRDNQVISGRAELVSHRGQIYLGLAVLRQDASATDFFLLARTPR